MKLTDAERRQLEIESLLRYTVLKLRADGGALLRPRDEASPLLVARTDLWPHDGVEQAAAVWRHSQRALLRGEPVRRGTLCILPLSARHAGRLEALLACTGLPDDGDALRNDDHQTLFDLLVRQVVAAVAPGPDWDAIGTRLTEALPAGVRNRMQATTRETIEETLAATHGNVSAAARHLGVPVRTLYHHMQRFQIKPARYRVHPA